MPTPVRIEVTQFPGGKRLAVTTSFDDGVIHDRRVVRAFNEWGLKGTFNLNSGGLLRTGKPAPDTFRHIDASEVAELYRGHEVAVHTVSHPWLEKLDNAQIADEVLRDRCALEDLVGYPVRGMAYPFGTYNDRVIAVLRQLGIVYARTVENHWNCFPPREPLAWQTTAHQFTTTPEPVPQRFAELYANPRSTGLFFIWGHTYEFENRWEDLEKIFKPLLPDNVPPLHLRRLVCALSGSVMGFLSFAGIGMKREEVSASLPTLREGFLKGAGVWVTHSPGA